MNQTIIDAIENQNTLIFNYHNEQRTVEPHCYGVDNDGDPSLRAFQIGKGWRMFHLADMGPIHIGDAFRGARPNYRRNDKAMAQIYAQL
jgi:predicted DNA-binding transcriptional regulator YafY